MGLTRKDSRTERRAAGMTYLTIILRRRIMTEMTEDKREQLNRINQVELHLVRKQNWFQRLRPLRLLELQLWVHRLQLMVLKEPEMVAIKR